MRIFRVARKNMRTIEITTEMTDNDLEEAICQELDNYDWTEFHAKLNTKANADVIYHDYDDGAYIMGGVDLGDYTWYRINDDEFHPSLFDRRN